MNSFDDVKLAYKLYKKNIYFDKTDLLAKAEIANFESSVESIDNWLYNFSQFIDQSEELFINHRNNINFERLLQKISHYEYPKIKLNNFDPDHNKFYSNTNESLNELGTHKKIKGEIEIFIISTLWVMRYGNLFESKINLAVNYGNLLSKTENQLFEYYVYLYQNWEKDSLNSLEASLKEGKKVAYIQLDIRECFKSIELDWLDVHAQIGFGSNHLTDLLHQIHQRFDRSVNQFSPSSRTSLPVGLPSSSILANWYLSSIDNHFLNNSRVLSYHRYVDDILISYEIFNDLDTPDSILGSLFPNYTPQKDIELYINNQVLKFNYEKLKIYKFDPNYPLDALNKLKSEIHNNSSEFRFQSEFEIENEEELNQTFISQTTTKHKIKNTDEFRNQRFGLSVSLVKQIKIHINSGISNDRENLFKSYFTDKTTISNYHLWEKYILYLLVSSNYPELHSFLDVTGQVIQNINNETNQKSDRLGRTLWSYFGWSFAYAWSIGGNEQAEYYLSNKFDTSLMNKSNQRVKYLKKSNLIQHHFLRNKLITFTDFGQNIKYLKDEQTINFKNNSNKQLLLNSELLEWAPWFIGIDELSFHFSVVLGFSEKETLDQSYSIYESINTLPPNYYQRLSFSNDNNFLIQDDDSSIDKPKIAVVNFEPHKDSLSKKFIISPYPSVSHELEFSKTLNLIIQEKPDIVVFPELSILPYQVDRLIKLSKRHNMIVVFGLAYFKKGSQVFNNICTILPNKDDNSQTTILARNKNYYSPKEKVLLKGYKFKIPPSRGHKTYLYSKGISFGSFNCFELAHIKDRSECKGLLDLVISIAWNPDVSYYSNIAESVVRDNHCFFAQANHKKFGDSRITQPKKSYLLDIARIKGGINSSILVCEIDIKSLHNFQKLSHEAQIKLIEKSEEKNSNVNEKDVFKPTPPDFPRTPI